MHTEIVPGVPYHGTTEERDESVKGLFEQLQNTLEFKPINDVLHAKTRLVVEEWLNQEVCEGRIQEGALRYKLGLSRVENHIQVCFLPKEIGEAFFEDKVGRKPENDDLHRCNCEEPGAVGHLQCGWCPICDRPRFVCGHLAKRGG